MATLAPPPTDAAFPSGENRPHAESHPHRRPGSCGGTCSAPIIK